MFLLKFLTYKTSKAEGFPYFVKKVCPFDILALVGLIAVIFASFTEDSLPIGRLVFAYVLLVFSAVSADMDCQTTWVYSWLLYPPIIYGVAVCVVRLFTGQFVFSVDTVFELLPLVFTILTIKTRGFADTLLMIGYCLYGLLYGNPVTTLLGFLIGYVIQACLRIWKRKYKGKRLPFIPALFVGFVLSEMYFGRK